MKLKKTKKSFFIALCSLFVAFSICSCGNKGEYPTQKPEEKKLYIYNWTYYTPDDAIALFEKEFDCKVILDVFDSNETMYSKLTAAGGKGYDIVVPSQDYVSIMKNQGMLRPLDLSKFPNKDKINPIVLEKATYDPNMQYAVPYYMGAAGISVNKTKVQDYARDWSIFADTRLKGKMSMMDDMREVLGDALKHLGYSVCTTDKKQLEEARDLVKNQWKPNLVAFDAESFGKEFSKGEFWVCQGYAECVFTELPEDKWDTVDFFIPQEGGPMYLDSMCILKKSTHFDLAMEFINFIHRPEIYAKFLDFFHFPATVNMLAAQYTTTKPLYKAQEVFNCEAKNDLGQDLATWDQIWEQVRFAQ